jgi:hypothetical protein
MLLLAMVIFHFKLVFFVSRVSRHLCQGPFVLALNVFKTSWQTHKGSMGVRSNNNCSRNPLFFHPGTKSSLQEKESSFLFLYLFPVSY